jgi:hypothetical protein
MKFLIYVLIASVLSACGVDTFIKANDDRYAKPGAMDSGLPRVYDTYQFKFMEKYQITHQWPRDSWACGYAKLPTLNVKDGFHGEFYDVSDIYEKDGKTWQISSHPGKPFDFDKFVRSIKVKGPKWDTVNGVRKIVGEEEYQNGLEPVCHNLWAGTGHALTISLEKQSLADAMNRIKKRHPEGNRIYTKKVGNNEWTVIEREPTHEPVISQSFQFWFLPIKDTGYVFEFSVGASHKSLNYPVAHARILSAFDYLINSLEIKTLP